VAFFRFLSSGVFPFGSIFHFAAWLKSSFWVKYLPKLNQEDIKKKQRQKQVLMISKIEAIIKSLPTKKTPGLGSFLHCTTPFKEEHYQFSSNYSMKYKGKGLLPNSFCEARITLIPKLDKKKQTKKFT
jgi:hypothetical protein